MKKSSLIVGFDVECYPNYFLAKFIKSNGAISEYVRTETEDFDANALLEELLSGKPLVSFNGISYDVPMIVSALAGSNNATLKEHSDAIIQQNMKPWEFYDTYKFMTPEFLDHVDVIEVAPGVLVSLKLYMARMHAPTLQDLPYTPDTRLTPKQQKEVSKYCANDIIGTLMLFQRLREQIKLRETLSREIQVDVRSKSDAQIAEAVLRSEYQKRTGWYPRQAPIDIEPWRYEAPKYVKFLTEPLHEMLEMVESLTFEVKPSTGHVIMPEELSDYVINIGNTDYKMGLGGLHSQESEVAHHSNDNTLLIDWDVTSYYPTMILNMMVTPPSFGYHFGHIYNSILRRRLDAKRSGDMITSDTLKITLNGTFGKLSNIYSRLYTPEDMLRTTLTGQLSLLMLIELLELYGVPVVSANTDGIVLKCPTSKYKGALKISKAWEKRCKLQLEEARYVSLYSRDVNNYLAIKENGQVKRKGVFTPPGLMKNPQNEVVLDAVILYLTEGKCIKEHIESEQDIRKFITARTVKGGGVFEDEYLGKVVRWYYSVDSFSTINYKTSGNKVPKSFGAKPCMVLPKTLPDDIDYDRYIDEAKELLWDMAALPRPVFEKLPRKNSKAWKEFEQAGKIVQYEEGNWFWNKEIRDVVEREQKCCPLVLQQME